MTFYVISTISYIYAQGFVTIGKLRLLKFPCKVNVS